MNENDIKKKVDESWKDTVVKEKAKSDTSSDTSKETDYSTPPKADIISFISTLSMQALMGMGLIPNPINNKPEENLDQARYIIDIIDMLYEKTQGNLTVEETKFIENVLYELRTKFVEKTK